jgi:hypothetical protein
MTHETQVTTNVEDSPVSPPESFEVARRRRRLEIDKLTLAQDPKLTLAQDLIQEAYHRFLDETDGYDEESGDVLPEVDAIFVEALLGKASG